MIAESFGASNRPVCPGEDMLDIVERIFGNEWLQKAADASPLNSPNSPLNWVFLAAFLSIALIVFLTRSGDERRRGFASFLFPREIYLHPDAFTGYGVYIINKVLFAVLGGFIILNLSGPISLAVSDWLSREAPFLALAGPPPFLIALIVGGVLFVIQDFYLFYFHYLCHKIPALWEVHKLHHAPRVLTPFSDFQVHPIEAIVRDLFYGAWLGLALGATNAVIAGEARDIDLGAVFWPYMIVYAFSHFRHTHIPIHFPPAISRFVVSPAYHQIHHSRDPEHWDKNMAVVFSVWDRMFGTYFLPKKGVALDYGLATEAESARYRGVINAYAEPVRALVRMGKARLSTPNAKPRLTADGPPV